MQKLPGWILVSMTSVATVSTSWAATVVEQRGMQGQTQKITINMPLARIDSSKPAQYILVNTQEKKMYMVDSDKKRILAIDMAAAPSTPPSMPPGALVPPAATVEAKLDKKGEGPEIAGYSTIHYQTIANGTVCSNEYLSAEAMKVESVKSLLVAMDDLASARKKMMGPMPMPQQDPCMQAYDKLQSEYKSIGVPLKITDKEGKVINEITSIKVEVEVAADLLTLPKDYKITTEEEMRKEFMRKMEEAQKQQGSNPQMMPPGGGGPAGPGMMAPPR